MTFIGLTGAAGYLTFGFLMAFLALLAASRIELRKRSTENSDEATIFLFEQLDLIDASPKARHLLSTAHGGDDDWSRLLSLLTSRYSGIETALETLDETGRLSVYSDDGQNHLSAVRTGASIRVTITGAGPEAETVEMDVHTLTSIERELESLRAIADEAHFLMWRQDQSGRVSWINRAYLDQVTRIHGISAAETWPPPTLFDVPLQSISSEAQTSRVLLKDSPLNEDWYEVHATALSDDVLMTAVNASTTVHAEQQLREFMQTLTKTFAHLTIGLAVFDRERQLALFNPALTDLTKLPADFLTERPSLFGFLDKLRERNMIPEPKDYKSWRRRIVELEAAAADGTYSEIWSLPNGQTYRVAGRPHPDGAVALLFEDISAEISLTRRFRAELELGQSAIDSLADAIAVFSSSGLLVLSNNAYGEFWGDDPGTQISEITVNDAVETWMRETAPTPVWGDFRDFVAQSQDRAEWAADVRLKDGRLLSCTFAPIAGGATLVRFHLELDATAQILPVTRPA